MAYHPCMIEIFVDRIRIVCHHEEVAVHHRCYTAGQFILDPRHYLKLLERKPGAWTMPSLQGPAWGESFAWIGRNWNTLPADGTLRYIQVLLLFTKYPSEQVQRRWTVRATAASVRTGSERSAQRTSNAPAAVGSLGPAGVDPARQRDSDVAIYDQLKSRERCWYERERFLLDSYLKTLKLPTMRVNIRPWPEVQPGECSL